MPTYRKGTTVYLVKELTSDDLFPSAPGLMKGLSLAKGLRGKVKANKKFNLVDVDFDNGQTWTVGTEDISTRKPR